MRGWGLVVAVAWISCLCVPQSLASDAASVIAACLDCHDYGEDSPAHLVLRGSHGMDADEAGRHGCLDCHGASGEHIEAPRQHAPDVSFGPRWTASGSSQDATCLNCHREGVAKHWPDALHMANNLTCITCHDIHTEQDRVLVADTQIEVCTTCHKAQKTGIHDLGSDGPENPPCGLCHNPHNHQAAEPQMAANTSAGCTFCHNAEEMDTLAALNPKAGNYHSAIERSGRQCLGCHQGISHAPEDSAPLLHPAPMRGRQVTLFYPGNATRQWLNSAHPGSQPLRQGADCSLCHRGDEARMGASLGAGMPKPSRPVGIQFAREQDQVFIDIRWTGSADDTHLALMWGEDNNTEFRRGGCFAACHDNPRSPASRILYHGVEGDSSASMGGLLTGAALWRVSLATGDIETTRVGAGPQRNSPPAPATKVQFRDGQWSVRLAVRTLQEDGSAMLSDNQRYTFGIALHGKNNTGRDHWVSLPMTLSLSGHSTDFIAE